jgi:hypothetical protein
MVDVRVEGPAVELDTGEVVTEEPARRVIEEEVADEFPDFLTLPAYGLVD